MVGPEFCIHLGKRSISRLSGGGHDLRDLVAMNIIKLNFKKRVTETN